MRYPVALLFCLVVFGCSEEPKNNENNSNNVIADVGDEDTSADVGGDLVLTQAARDYCECMLFTCHDPWHLKHGVDDAVAMADCVAEASAIPQIGTPQTSGNSVECRQNFCDLAKTEPNNCADALGPGCVDE